MGDTTLFSSTDGINKEYWDEQVEGLLSPLHGGDDRPSRVRCIRPQPEKSGVLDNYTEDVKSNRRLATEKRYPDRSFDVVISFCRPATAIPKN